MAILESEGIDFRSKTVTRQSRTFHSTKSVKSSRNGNYKLKCTQQRSSKPYETNIARSRGRVSYATVSDLSPSLLIMNRASRQMINMETEALNNAIKPRRRSRHTRSTPTRNSLLLKSKRGFPQDKPSVRPPSLCNRNV